jgi:5'-nucleotidase
MKAACSARAPRFTPARRIARRVSSRALALIGGALVSACGPRAVPQAEVGREGTAASQAQQPVGSDQRGRPNKRLRVIGTNDFHGALRPTTPSWADRPVGGAAALAAYFARVRAAVDAPTLLLDGGDVMQGTPLSNLTFGRSTVEYYNRAGYTAVAFGNHEFDWGADTLAARVRQARFAWLGANILVKGTDTLPSWSRATHTVVLPGCRAGPLACDSVRVGIIGISTQTTPTVTLPSNVAAFEFEDEAAAIDRWVPRLRAEGADFVIVVSHEGAYCATPPSQSCGGRMLDIASRLRYPPDLIVGGHTHAVVHVRPSGVPLVQAGSSGTYFTVVDLERVSADSVAVTVTDQSPTWVDGVVPDSAIAATVARYAAEIGPILDRVVATLDRPLVRGGREHALGNLVADAQRRATNAQIAIMNNGGIRTDLAAGPVRYEDLFRVQPFGNTLVVMELSGAAILRALEHSLGGGQAGGHFSGVRVRFSPGAEAGRRVTEATLDSGEPVRPDAQYRVVVNNFLAEGGDGYTMLLEGRGLDHTGIVDLDALIEHLGSLPSPTPLPATGRFTPVDRLF